jgi:hypothetical protein
MIEIIISLVACLSITPKSSKSFDVLKQQKPENVERNKEQVTNSIYQVRAFQFFLFCERHLKVDLKISTQLGNLILSIFF